MQALRKRLPRYLIRGNRSVQSFDVPRFQVIVYRLALAFPQCLSWIPALSSLRSSNKCFTEMPSFLAFLRYSSTPQRTTRALCLIVLRITARRLAHVKSVPCLVVPSHACYSRYLLFCAKPAAGEGLYVGLHRSDPSANDVRVRSRLHGRLRRMALYTG